MMKRMALAMFGVLALGTTWRANAATIVPAVEYATSGTLTDSRPFTLGYSFTTSVAYSINALGYWDDGLGNAHQVGLWDSAGNLLVSTTVLGTDQLVGHFRWHDVSFNLAPGSYVIAGEFLGNNDPFVFDAQGVVTIPGYTYGTDLQEFGAGLNFPTLTTNGTYGDNGILMVSFSVGDTAAVPEPASGVLLGIAGVVAFGRRLRRRA